MKKTTKKVTKPYNREEFYSLYHVYPEAFAKLRKATLAYERAVVAFSNSIAIKNNK